MDLIEILRRKDKQISHLRTRALTQAKKLGTYISALAEHKRFMVAIASGEYGNVERLVRVALKQKAEYKCYFRALSPRGRGNLQPEKLYGRGGNERAASMAVRRK